MSKLSMKKCMNCGAIVKVIKDCKCEEGGIKCCDEPMKELVPNSIEASFEKHVPTYEIKDGKLFVWVNHVMEEDHYIEWISVVSDKGERTVYFKPGEEPKMSCCMTEAGTMIYAYCNKHELWNSEVK